jgi:3-hydroxyacyl-CoA dehydrogenase
MNASNRKIKKVAVLGSGVMCSRLACHFANIGLQTYLLDIVPFDLKEEEKTIPAARNRIVNAALDSTLKSNPSPIYDKAFASRIKTGNFDDNMEWIKDCDWILEAVVENIDIKKQVFEKVEKYRKPGTLITSNTSGIPIHQMTEGRSEDFKKYFCGTHFFNPPRYLKLLEVIPTQYTDPSVVEFFMHYGARFLGKTMVLCKDTPAFIANRVGVFSIMAIFHLMKEMDMTVEEIDALTGPLIGKPKSATFRTCDVVGIDTLVKVAKGVYDNCGDDEARDLFQIPDYVNKLVENKWFGDKSGQGFYKKEKSAAGKQILALDVKSFEYKASEKPKFACIAATKPIENLKERLVALNKQSDKGAEFLKKLGYHLYKYVSNRVPEISDEVYRLDDAMCAGFGWEIGPFENWDVLGVERTVKAMKEAGFAPAPWIDEMLAGGNTSFYKIEKGVKFYYDMLSKSYKQIPGQDKFIKLDNLRANAPVWKSSACTLHDLGDGILNLEWNTKMNSIGGEVIEGVNKAIEIAEKDWKGLVIANEGTQAFSAGANIGMIFMLAIDEEWDELNFAIAAFPNTMMRVRYSSIPVVIAPHSLTLGGACEMTMHSDAAILAAETYIGLVEVGVGVIPGGGGTKEMALRASDAYYNGDPQLPTIFEKFTTIATAKVATSAYEGFGIGVLDKKKDSVCVNADMRIMEAKKKALELSDLGYVQPMQRTDIEVLGRTGLGALYSGATSFNIGGYATEHDVKVARKLAYVMCGGDLSEKTKVSEQYLLDLEREAFLSLCGEKKTLERLQSILTTGKPLRN